MKGRMSDADVKLLKVPFLTSNFRLFFGAGHLFSTSYEEKSMVMLPISTIPLDSGYLNELLLPLLEVRL